MSDPKYKMVCGDCGSEDVGLDAIAKWNLETQEWELSSTYDHGYCADCDCDNVTGVEI